MLQDDMFSSPLPKRVTALNVSSLMFRTTISKHRKRNPRDKIFLGWCWQRGFGLVRAKFNNILLHVISISSMRRSVNHIHASNQHQKKTRIVRSTVRKSNKNNAITAGLAIASWFQPRARTGSGLRRTFPESPSGGRGIAVKS